MFGCIEMQYLVGPADLVGQSENLAALDISRGEEAEVVMTHAEEAMTWAEQVAARKARDAWRDAFTAQVDITNQLNEWNALRPKVVTPGMWSDADVFRLRAIIAELEDENARLAAIVDANESYASASVPSFPLNAIKHSA